MEFPVTYQDPTREQFAALVEQCGLKADAAEVEFLQTAVTPLLEAYRLLDTLDDNAPPNPGERDPGYQPDRNEDPLNAWYR
ncbi:MAG: hypothetical protein JWQ11_4190, partial [Rhizobacter sp.]|nr:hypothetical protein [Rhizobacter sp.]